MMRPMISDQCELIRSTEYYAIDVDVEPMMEQWYKLKVGGLGENLSTH